MSQFSIERMYSNIFPLSCSRIVISFALLKSTKARSRLAPDRKDSQFQELQNRSMDEFHLAQKHQLNGFVALKS